MKRFLSAAFLFALIPLFSLSAQATPVVTGDKQLDSDLASLDTSATANLQAYYAKLAARFNMSVTDVASLANSSQLKPDALYLVLELATTTGKSPADVAAVFAASKGKGWGVIAGQLGIKPGSDQFFTLKDGARTDVEIDKMGEAQTSKESPPSGVVASTDGKDTSTGKSETHNGTKDTSEPPQAPEAPHK